MLRKLKPPSEERIKAIRQAFEEATSVHQAAAQRLAECEREVERAKERETETRRALECAAFEMRLLERFLEGAYIEEG
jgi:chromosome segregation ATPase